MRLWHKCLIPYLPRQQLLGQWRECCLIAQQIATNGAPNHILVNRIMDYTIEDFIMYGNLVCDELRYRGYSANEDAFNKYFGPTLLNAIRYSYSLTNNIFDGWHDDVYLRECLYNLEEKYRADGISQDEWNKIYDAFHDFTPLIY